MTSVTRRAAVLLATVILAGCAGQGGSASPSASASASASESSSAAGFDWKRYSGTEITFLANQHPWTDGMNTVLDQFTAETGIKVNVQPFSEDLYFDKMEQTIRGTGTDVYFLPMDSTAFGQYSADLIEPLTPYLNDPSKTSPDYDFADFPKGFLAGAEFPAGDANAQLYGIPISFETYILFYNKDLLKQLTGLDEAPRGRQQLQTDGENGQKPRAVTRRARGSASPRPASGSVAGCAAPRACPLPVWRCGRNARDRSSPRRGCAACRGRG